MDLKLYVWSITREKSGEKNQVRSNRCWDSEVKAPGGEEHKENKIIKQKISHLIHCRLLRQWTVMLLMMLGLMAKEK